MAKTKKEKPEEIKSTVQTDLNNPPVINLKTFDFPINSKFMMGNALYTVIGIHNDSNTQWRTVISAQNGDQDFMLETIRKDAKYDPTFIVVDVGTPVK